MKENCLDIGVVQAFMDGELPHDRIASVSDHLEWCSSCTALLVQAEEESAFVFSALDREMNTLVPTQRLWNKINDSIEAQHDSLPFWQKARTFLAAAFASPSLVGAAALLIAVGTLSIVLLDRDPSTPDVADIRRQAAPQIAASTQPAVAIPIVDEPKVETPSSSIPRIERAVYRPQAAPAVASRPIRTTPAVSTYVEGEESYVRTISSLARTIDDQKDTVLRPSERVAYERDMALVDDTIAKMREEVKRNPRNESAKQVLYSSLQTKIDLLNSVSQKEELVSSLK